MERAFTQAAGKFDDILAQERLRGLLLNLEVVNFMKRCPNCNLVYSNENNYCLTDGTALISDAPEVPTLIARAPFTEQPVPPVRPGKINSLGVYLAIGLFAVIVGGAVVAYVKFTPSPVNAPAQQKNDAPSGAASPAPPNGGVSQEPASKRGEVVQYPDAKPQPLTADAVRNLLSAWERAQDTRNFATYQACYDASFIGVKTKGSTSQNYNYSSWMADRRRMIGNAVNLNVDISGLQIRVEGDTAFAEFDQYYRSLRYSDWGPKEIRVKMTPSGAKIVYEVLKASHPL